MYSELPGKSAHWSADETDVAPRRGETKVAQRRRLSAAFIIFQCLLVILACEGALFLVRLHLTGTLRALPRYSPGSIQAAGWMRPVVAMDDRTQSTGDFDAPVAGSRGVEMFNLSTQATTASDLHLLILTPLQNSVGDLPRLFSILDSLSHPKAKTSLGFIVGDETDHTGAALRLLCDEREGRYRRISLISHNFGLELPLSKFRHLKSAQALRRSQLAKVRSILLTSTLRADHDWVLWLDSDVSEVPPSLVEDLLVYGYTGVGATSVGDNEDEFNDIVSPQISRIHGVEPHGYDLNNWSETPESEDQKFVTPQEEILVEGSSSKRIHLTDLWVAPNASWYDKLALLHSNLYSPASSTYIGRRVRLDGVGGVATMVRAHVHRLGAVFPAWVVDHQVETEGFAVLARMLGARIVGLPNYLVIHK